MVYNLIPSHYCSYDFPYYTISTQWCVCCMIDTKWGNNFDAIMANMPGTYFATWCAGCIMHGLLEYINI